MITLAQATLILDATSTTAAVFSGLLFLPQMFKSFITKKTADSSLFLYILTVLADIFWLLYGITLFMNSTSLGGINLMWQNAFVGVVAFILLSFKFINIKKSKSLGISEAAYCNKMNIERKAKRKNPNSSWAKFIDVLTGENK